MAAGMCGNALHWVPVAACLLGGCAARQGRILPEESRENLFVVRDRWHTSLLIPLSGGDDPVERRVFRAVSESSDMHAPRFLEWGFGDSRWSLSEQPRVLSAVGTLVWPAPGCLTLRFLSEAPAQSADRTVRRIPLSPEGMREVRRRVGLWMDPDGYLGEPLPGTFFWRSRRRFHPFNTCHDFVEEALRGISASAAR